MNAVEMELFSAGNPTFAGTPAAVGKQLEHLRGGQAVALVLQDSPKVDVSSIELLLKAIVKLAGVAIAEQNEKTLANLIETLVPRTPPPPALLKEAAMVARAQKAVMNGSDWLTAAQLAEVAGLSDKNPSAQPGKWKRNNSIFAISHNGNDYYPGYGLDRDNGYRPLKSLKPIIECFEGTKNGWGLAYWFESVNSYLGGKRPKDLLVSDPGSVLAAAVDERVGVLHG